MFFFRVRSSDEKYSLNYVACKDRLTRTPKFDIASLSDSKHASTGKKSEEITNQETVELEDQSTPNRSSFTSRDIEFPRSSISGPSLGSSTRKMTGK